MVGSPTCHLRWAAADSSRDADGLDEARQATNPPRIRRSSRPEDGRRHRRPTFANRAVTAGHVNESRLREPPPGQRVAPAGDAPVRRDIRAARAFTPTTCPPGLAVSPQCSYVSRCSVVSTLRASGRAQRTGESMTRITPIPYEPPAVKNHGTLQQLTLGSGGSS